MNRKDLFEKYNIIGDNKYITLYRKKGEYKYGFGYCGNIILKNNKAYFNDIAYSTIEELDKALVEWENSLPYPVDTYNPMMRKGYRIESQLVWYLTEKLGFKLNTTDWKSNYIKKIGDSFELTFEIKQKNIDNNIVTISSFYGDYYFTQDVDNTEEGIRIIDTLVNYETLTMAKDFVDIVCCCGEKVTNEIDTIVRDNSNILGFRKINFKKLMIDKLENVLKELKS